MPPNERASRTHAEISSLSSRPERGDLDSLQPHFLSLPLIHTCSAIKASTCGTSFKNIKYKTLPYSISNHSIYKFIFSKKKKKSKRYSNSTQFKFFFSSLNFPKEKFQKQEKPWCMAAILRGPGECDSPTIWSVSAQSHSCKDIQMWKILGPLSFGGQVNQ